MHFQPLYIMNTSHNLNFLVGLVSVQNRDVETYTVDKYILTKDTYTYTFIEIHIKIIISNTHIYAHEYLIIYEDTNVFRIYFSSKCSIRIYF